MPAEPQGAPDTTGPSLPVPTTGCPGRNGTRCSRTPIGPTPGPPPPCGMQNVLWRLRWLTSEPKRPGLASPTMALRLAPAAYAGPAATGTAPQSYWMSTSNTPCVDG